MIKYAVYETINHGDKVFIFDDEVYDTDEKVRYAMEVSDMGAGLPDCLTLTEREHEFLERCIRQRIERLNKIVEDKIKNESN